MSCNVRRAGEASGGEREHRSVQPEPAAVEPEGLRARVPPGAPPKLTDNAGQKLPPGGLTGELVEPAFLILMRREVHATGEEFPEELPHLDRPAPSRSSS